MRTENRPTIATIAICLISLGFAGLVSAGCQHATSDDANASEGSGSLEKEQGENEAGGKSDRASSDSSSSSATYDPCAGKSCGERCTKCPPNAKDCVETAALKFCHSDGSCEATTPTCGGGSTSCTSDADCGSDEYCEKSGSNACSSSTTGTCTPEPDACPLHVQPVCGCDGTTYNNSCSAAAAGVNVAHDGKCSSDGGSGDYDPCKGKTCGERCTKCPPNDSDCVETTVVKYCQPDGTCSATQPQCNAPSGCTSNADCDSDEFCEKSGSNACSAQTSGTCTPTPDACPLYFSPVCGCDGETYSNSCLADHAGVNVAHDGEC